MGDIREIIREAIKEVINESNFDLSNNTFIQSLNLNPAQVSTLQVIINLMTVDESWVKEVYPNGYTSTEVINDVIKLFNNVNSALDVIATKNPVAYSNQLKAVIKKRKGVVKNDQLAST